MAARKKKARRKRSSKPTHQVPPPRHGGTLTEAERDRMFQAFTVHQSERAVVAATGHNRKTVRRWREKDRWDERLGAIRQQAHANADDKMADDRAKLQGIVRAMVAAASGTILTKDDLGKAQLVTAATVAEFERLVKLHLLLEGDPTERIEVREREVATRIIQSCIKAVMDHVRSPKEREDVKRAILADVGRSRAG